MMRTHNRKELFGDVFPVMKNRWKPFYRPSLSRYHKRVTYGSVVVIYYIRVGSVRFAHSTPYHLKEVKFCAQLRVLVNVSESDRPTQNFVGCGENCDGKRCDGIHQRKKGEPL